MDGSGFAAVLAFVMMVGGFFVTLPIWVIIVAAGDHNYRAVIVGCVWLIPAAAVIIWALIKMGSALRKRRHLSEFSDISGVQ